MQGYMFIHYIQTILLKIHRNFVSTQLMWFNINISELFSLSVFVSVKDDLKACLCQKKEVQLEKIILLQLMLTFIFPT